MSFNIKKELDKLIDPYCPCGCDGGEWPHDGRSSFDFGAAIKAKIIVEFEKLQKELEGYKGKK